MMAGAYGSFPFMWHIHWLFGSMILFGSVLLLAWLIKEGKKDTIATVVWVTLVVGILGALFTAGPSMSGLSDFRAKGYTQMFDYMKGLAE